MFCVESLLIAHLGVGLGHCIILDGRFLESTNNRHKQLLVVLWLATGKNLYGIVSMCKDDNMYKPWRSSPGIDRFSDAPIRSSPPRTVCGTGMFCKCGQPSMLPRSSRVSARSRIRSTSSRTVPRHRFAGRRLLTQLGGCRPVAVDTFSRQWHTASSTESSQKLHWVFSVLSLPLLLLVGVLVDAAVTTISPLLI